MQGIRESEESSTGGGAVPLTLASSLYDRMQALYTGEAKPEGIDLNFVAIDSPREIFDRFAGGEEFDVAELSCSEFIARFSAGQCPFVALPVFPSRVFRHGFITINKSAGISAPKDLEGKRVGVPLYTMTAAIWIRAHLQHEYGVDLSTIDWVEGAINAPGGHGEPSVLPLLREIPITQNRSGKSLSQLLSEGEIDAIIGTSLPDSRHHDKDVQRLFPNFREVEKDYYRRTGIFPIMHLLAIRRATYEKHPFVARSLYRALCESKRIALARMRSINALRYMLPWMPDYVEETEAVFGADPWPYGVEANLPTLRALMTYMVEQGLIRDAIPIEALFVAVDQER